MWVLTEVSENLYAPYHYRTEAGVKQRQRKLSTPCCLVAITQEKIMGIKTASSWFENLARGKENNKPKLDSGGNKEEVTLPTALSHVPAVA
jgi:hypothetical protein